MRISIAIYIILSAITISAYAQSPFASNKQSVLLSNAQSGASERWIALFAPASLSTNYRLILPTTAPSVGQLLNVASISGSDYTMQWSSINSLAWSLTGNSGTNSTTNFIGTTDAQDVMFKANNTERLTLKQSSGFLHLNQINQNTMMGYQVANMGLTGGANTGLGYQALYNTTTGSGNVAVGFVSLSQNQTGTNNTGVGIVALNGILGSYNVGVGAYSGYSMTGEKNTVLGYYAGFLHTSGDRNIFIGDSSRHPSGTSGSNLMSIGNAIYGNGINTTTPRIGIGAVSYASDVTLDVRGHTAISNADNTAKELRFYEPSNSGLNYSSLRAGIQTANITYTLPTVAPTAGQVLSSDASGTMSWANLTTAVGGTFIVHKASNESVTNSTTLQNDDALTMAIGANEVWHYQFECFVTGNDGDIKFAITIPAGATMRIGVQSGNFGSGDDYDVLTTSGAESTKPFDVGADNKCHFVISGIVSNSTTAGNVQLQWAQLTSNGTPTVVQSLSYVKGHRVQ